MSRKQTARKSKKSPHICEFCNKSYATKSSLALHKKIHIGVKNFSCICCKKKFMRKFTLNQHILRIHPDSNKDTGTRSTNKVTIRDLGTYIRNLYYVALLLPYKEICIKKPLHFREGEKF